MWKAPSFVYLDTFWAFLGTFPIRPVLRISWLLNWIILWIESAQCFLNWITFWIESSVKQYWIEYWINHFLAIELNWIRKGIEQPYSDHWGCLGHRIVGSVVSGRCWFVYQIHPPTIDTLVTGMILTTIWLHSDYIPTTFWLHSDSILIRFWLHFDYILTTFWLHFDYILTTLWLIPSDYRLTTFWLYSDYSLITFWLHSDYFWKRRQKSQKQKQK